MWMHLQKYCQVSGGAHGHVFSIAPYVTEEESKVRHAVMLGAYCTNYLYPQLIGLHQALAGLNRQRHSIC